MKLSINIRNWGPYSTRDILLACAQAADESGLDTVWINERLTSSLDAPANMPQVVTPGRTLEPLSMLASPPGADGYRGTIIFTNASAAFKGYPRSGAFAMACHGKSGLAQSIARELMPPGICVGLPAGGEPVCK